LEQQQPSSWKGAIFLATATRGQGVAVYQGTFIMKGGAIYGNAIPSREGGGVLIFGDGLIEMYGGRIQGSTDSDGFTRNFNRQGNVALHLTMSRSKWGTGGAYTHRRRVPDRRQ